MIDLVILLASIPVGLVIAWLARDELVMGRKWFVSLILLCLVDIAFCIYFDIVYGTLTSAFIIVVTSISLWKSYDRKWTKLNK